MMTMPEIERCLRQLRLSGVRDTLQTRVLQAQGANQPFLETFSLILQDELDRRQSRLIERRYRQSGLDEKLTLAEFDWSFNLKLPLQTCFQLHTLAFIAAGESPTVAGNLVWFLEEQVSLDRHLSREAAVKYRRRLAELDPAKVRKLAASIPGWFNSDRAA